MADFIIPTFIDFAVEGAIVGRLLAGYGELELELCQCVAAVTRNIDDVIRKLFNLRGEKRRIDCADDLARAPYTKAGLGVDYSAVINKMHYCRELRNQYAHCQWYGTSQDGFAFVNLEEVSKLNTAIFPLESHRCLVDAALLRQQETFFKHVQRYFWYLTGEYQTRVNGQHGNVWSLPAVLAQPARHR
jgi:hypothetical protein